MGFTSLKVKVRKRLVSEMAFKKSKAKRKSINSFRSGYNSGWNDCLRWVINIFEVKNVGELKMITPKGDVKAGKLKIKTEPVEVQRG